MLRPVLGLVLGLALAALLAAATAPALAADPNQADPVWWAQAREEAKAQGYRLIDAQELQRLMGSGAAFTLLDVRPDYEFARDHIPGAKNLEFHLGDRMGISPDKAAKLKAIAGPDLDRPLVVYCRSFKCLRSGIAARMAAREGYRHVLRFAAGWHGWLAHTGRPVSADMPGLAAGDFFPACRLVVLGGESDRQYLGLPAGAKAFGLAEVPADYLFVELYSQLCYGCLQAVESYNQLYKSLTTDPELKGRVKMVGMGVGSLNREVVNFRRHEGVLFPLFADQGRELFHCLGEPPLPLAYVLKREAGPRLRILGIVPGGNGQVGEVLGRIKAAVKGAAP